MCLRYWRLLAEPFHFLFKEDGRPGRRHMQRHGICGLRAEEDDNLIQFC